MKTLKDNWAVVVLAVAVGALAALLVVKLGDAGPAAYGQVSPGVTSGNAVAILGERYNNEMVPLFLVDTKEQNILVYEYSLSRRKLFLRVARSFVNDRELQDWNWGDRDLYSGPSVKDVQNMLRGK